MIKVNLGGCASFVKDEDYKEYVGKALEAFDVLANESGAGNDFLGWKRLPSETPEALIAECEAVRDNWKAKGVNLVVVIGIGGSYLGARCAIEALSHNFAKQLSGAKEAPEVVFAGNNLSEEYLAELMDLVAERNVATVVISKSGTTTEPAVAFRIVKEHIEKNYTDASERIVAITDAHKGALKTLSTQEAPEVVFAGNNLSEEYLAELMDLVAERNVATVVISKSGTTTEPAVAFRIVKEHIEKNYTDASERIVAITDAHKGALKTLSTQEGYKTFVVPDNVGGRFSVLTPVGLLPIVLAGFDVREMLAGAAEMEKALAVKGEENPAVQYAAMRNLLYSKLGKKVEILVAYNPKFQYLGEWWKQLYGESEGKDLKGIFPASVNFTTDLHSMGQFIQDGDRVVFETVVNIEKSNREVIIGSDEQNLDQLNYLAGQHVEHCNAMAQLGTKLAHIDGGVPQLEVSIEKINAFNLGGLFYFFEYACGVSAYVLGVNPFNQPGVEAYKKNMFALLGKPGYEEQGKALQARL